MCQAGKMKQIKKLFQYNQNHDGKKRNKSQKIRFKIVV